MGECRLACLYRNLCKASKSGAKSIAGPLMLLQLWAWCRIRATSPINVGERNDMPFGVRYIIFFLLKLNNCLYGQSLKVIFFGVYVGGVVR